MTQPEPTMPEAEALPRIAFLLGDCTGIGPELVARVLHDGRMATHARLVVVGDARVLERGMNDVGVSFAWERVDNAGAIDWASGIVPVIDLGNIDPERFPQGVASAESGRLTGETLAHAIRMAQRGEVDGITFAPLNKRALYDGGWKFPDEHKMFANLLGHNGHFSEMNVLDGQWMTRVTSHVSLREAIDQITPARIEDALRLADRAMRQAGIEKPRIAVAALNPHNGEGRPVRHGGNRGHPPDRREDGSGRYQLRRAFLRQIPSTSRPLPAPMTACSRCITTRGRLRPSSRALTVA